MAIRAALGVGSTDSMPRPGRALPVDLYNKLQDVQVAARAAGWDRWRLSTRGPATGRAPTSLVTGAASRAREIPGLPPRRRTAAGVGTANRPAGVLDRDARAAVDCLLHVASSYAWAHAPTMPSAAAGQPARLQLQTCPPARRVYRGRAVARRAAVARVHGCRWLGAALLS